MSGYQKTGWTDGTGVSISAANLNKIEYGLESIHGFDNAQALRDQPVPTHTTTAVTLGALTCGDGGAGLWCWIADSTAADSLGTVLLPSGHSGSGRWHRQFTGAVNVAWYGATAESADSTAAVQAAVSDCVNHGNSVYLPGNTRTWHFSEINVPQGVTVFGEPGGFATKIEALTSNSKIFFTSDAPACTFENLTFYGRSNITEKGEDVTTIAISLESVANSNIDCNIKSCSFVYFHTAIALEGRNLTIANDSYFSNCKYGIRSDNTANVTQDWRGLHIDGSTRFHSMTKDGATGACVYIPSSRNFQEININGVYADDCKTLFLGFASGIDLKATMPKARGTGVILEGTVHGIAVRRRNIKIELSYTAYEPYLSSPYSAVFDNGGLHSNLEINNTVVYGCGGYGIYVKTWYAKISGCRVTNAGQAANNTYAAIQHDGNGGSITDCLVTQDLPAAKYTANVAAYGFFFGGDRIYSGANHGHSNAFGTGFVGLASGIQTYGEQPHNMLNDPAILWGTAPPTTGKFATGSILRNRYAIADGNQLLIQWYCVSGGEPGSWVPNYVTITPPVT